MIKLHAQLAATALVAFLLCGCVPDEITVQLKDVEHSGEISKMYRAATPAVAVGPVACRKNLTMENTDSAHLQDGQRLRLTGPYEAEGHYKVRPIATPAIPADPTTDPPTPATPAAPPHHMKDGEYLVYNVSTGTPPDRDFQTVIAVDKGPHSATETDHLYTVTIAKEGFDDDGCPSEVVFTTAKHPGDKAAEPDHGGHSTGRD
jgi:hypothetical protein